MEDEIQNEEEKVLENEQQRAMSKKDGQLFTVFDLEGEEYGIGVDMMDEIVRDVDISRIPGSPDNVLGATNLRGEVIPVIDMKKILGLGKTGDEVGDTMIADMDGEKYAAPVDKLKDIVSAEKEQLVDPSNITNLDDKRLRWIIKLDDGRSIRVVNVRKIIDKEIGNIEIQSEE